MKKMGQAVTIKAEDDETRGWFFGPTQSSPHRVRSLAKRDTFELLARGESIHAL